MPARRLDKWGYCCGTLTRDRYLRIYPEQQLELMDVDSWFEKHSGYITGWEKVPRPRGGISRIFMGEGVRVILNNELEEKIVIERPVYEIWLNTSILRPETEISQDNDAAQTEEPTYVDNFVKMHSFKCPVHDHLVEERMNVADPKTGASVAFEYMHFPVRDGYCDPECTKPNVKCQHYTHTTTS